MGKKYELTDIKIEVFGKTLFRIKALRDIKRFGVEKGDLGGYIEKEENLDHDGDAWVYDNARVFGNAEVHGNARVYDDAEVYGNTEVYGNAEVNGNARVFGDTWVYGDARVFGNAEVYGDAEVFGDVWVFGDARVCGNADVIWLNSIGSRYETITAFRTKDGAIWIKCGCFTGTLDEFKAKVEETHGDNKYGREYKAAIELIKIHFEKEK